jgi:hypothetical protein
MVLKTGKVHVEERKEIKGENNQVVESSLASGKLSLDH